MMLLFLVRTFQDLLMLLSLQSALLIRRPAMQICGMRVSVLRAFSPTAEQLKQHTMGLTLELPLLGLVCNVLAELLLASAEQSLATRSVVLSRPAQFVRS
jgi:hypothetical protein